MFILCILKRGRVKAGKILFDSFGKVGFVKHCLDLSLVPQSTNTSSLISSPTRIQKAKMAFLQERSGEGWAIVIFVLIKPPVAGKWRNVWKASSSYFTFLWQQMAQEV